MPICGFSKATVPERPRREIDPALSRFSIDIQINV